MKKDETLDPVRKLERLIDSVFDYFARNPKVSMDFINQQRYIVQHGRESAFQDVYARTLHKIELIIAEGQKKGFFNTAVSANFYQSFFFGGIRNSLWQWANDTMSISLAELRSSIKTVLMACITAPGAEK